MIFGYQLPRLSKGGLHVLVLCVDLIIILYCPFTSAGVIVYRVPTQPTIP